MLYIFLYKYFERLISNWEVKGKKGWAKPNLAVNILILKGLIIFNFFNYTIYLAYLHYKIVQEFLKLLIQSKHHKISKL